MIYNLIIRLSLVIMICLSACSNPRTTVINGNYIMKSDGNLDDITGSVGEYYPEVILTSPGDKAIIRYNSKINLNVQIDTSKNTIVSHFNDENEIITFEVIAKNTNHKIFFNSLCDIYYIPEKQINIELIDDYNNSDKSKKFKLILVPNLSYDNKINGYLLRYDLEGGLKSCNSYFRINSIEENFNRNRNQSIRKTKKNNEDIFVDLDCLCKYPFHCDCLEFKYFGKCCPEK